MKNFKSMTFRLLWVPLALTLLPIGALGNDLSDSFGTRLAASGKACGLESRTAGTYYAECIAHVDSVAQAYLNATPVSVGGLYDALLRAKLVCVEINQRIEALLSEEDLDLGAIAKARAEYITCRGETTQAIMQSLVSQ
jgi:hypothetical protein